MGGDDGDDRGAVVVWRRWTERRDVPFHEYCSLAPIYHDDGWKVNREQAVAGQDPDIKYCTGVVRWGLRFTPLLVLVLTFAYLLLAEYSGAVAGIGTLLATFDLSVSSTVILAAVAWLVLLAIPLYVVNVIPSMRVLKGIVVYGLLGVLLGGVTLALIESTFATVSLFPDGAPERTVIDASGFLLLLLLGGLLVYDGMLRTENTFSALPEKTPAVISAPAVDGPDTVTYEQFVEEFNDALTADVVAFELRGHTINVRAMYVFAGLFLLPFFGTRLFELSDGTLTGVAWLLVTAPLDVVAAVLPIVLDFFLVVVFFQFLVLIAFFHRFLSDHGPHSDPDPAKFSIEYCPNHPDGYAGFKDVGRFATRVNTLLVIGGFYVAYRLYVLGFPVLEDMGPAPTTVEYLSWGVLYLVPLAVYVVAVIVWLYFSFWHVHRTMVRGREAKLREAVRPDSDLDAREIKDEPVWPVNSRLIVSILSLDALPLLSLVPLF